MAELSRLPVPVADVWEWQYQVLAARPTRSSSSTPRVSVARPGTSGMRPRSRLRRCPVIQQCREHGLSVREPYGVWGGLTEEDREAIYLAERNERREARKNAQLREAS